MFGGPAQTTMLASCVGQPLASTPAGVLDWVSHWREAFITSVKSRSLIQSRGVLTLIPILLAGAGTAKAGTGTPQVTTKAKHNIKTRFKARTLIATLLGGNREGEFLSKEAIGARCKSSDVGPYPPVMAHLSATFCT